MIASDRSDHAPHFSVLRIIYPERLQLFRSWRNPTAYYRTATGATVEPVPPWIFKGCMMKANS
jgi:hypothetical protein